MWLLDWRKVLVYVHRWLGIAGCVLFVAWFVSGVVMMYVRMPGLANEERLARAPALDLTTATRAPGALAETYGFSLRQVRVGMLGERPVYTFGGRGGGIVFADTGEFFEGLGRDQAARVAQRYAPGSEAVRYDTYLREPDQWTLQARLPLYRFALDDDADTHLYVSPLSGDVELRTTARERFWGYLGPVTHWVYFTPFRRHGPAWSEFIIWSSIVGCGMCLSGLVWGFWRFSPTSRFRLRRVPAHSPYAGWMKWHHYAGLLFGVVTLTWTYSGLLSMGPFDWFSSPPPSRTVRTAVAGDAVDPAGLTLSRLRQAVAAIGPAFAPRELELVVFRGRAFWRAYRPPTEAEAEAWMHVGLRPRQPRPRLEHVFVSATDPGSALFTSFGREAMEDVARAALPGVAIRDETWLDDYDGYYYDARGARALPVLRVRYDDEASTWLYLDPTRGDVVLRSVAVTRRRRWLYQGLHSLDFPFLYFERPLWDIVVIGLSLGGTILSVATMVPALRRLRRRGREWRRRWRTWRGAAYRPATNA